jgi:enamine deaminase RidA (YjgF/YER057c/UK114 family)
VLAAIDALLERAGSDKTKILMAQIYLSDIRDFPAMNAVWTPGLPRATATACHRPGAARQARLAGGDRGDRAAV